MVCFPLTTSVYLNNNNQLLPLTSQKNCGANPLPSLINVAGCQNVQFFIFFSFPAFTTLILGKEGFKVFAFDILKVALVVPLAIFFD